MSRHRQSSPSPVSLGRWNRLLVIVLGVLLVSWGGPAASAFWSSVSSNFGAAKADVVAQGATPATAVSGTSVTVTWAAGTTAAGRSVTGYSVARYSSATGGTKVDAAGTCAGTVTGLSCVDSGVTTGTWYYTVTPTLSQWQGAESVRSAATAVDATPPAAPVVTAPAYVNQATVGSVPVSGTAEPGSTVVLTVTDAGAAHTLTQTLTANGAGNWNATPLNLSTFNAGTITFSARATDAAGNTGPAGTDTSIKDVTVPTVTAVQLSNASGNNVGRIERDDTVTLTFSEALSANSICSAWTDNTTTQTQSANNQVTVSVSAADVLTVTSSGCPVLRVGSVALGGNYVPSGTLTFRGTGSNASALQWNPTAKTLTITLGTLLSGTPNTTAQSAAAASYTPASGLTDVAGNPLATSSVAGSASRF